MISYNKLKLIEEMYNSGSSTDEISKKFNIKDNTARRYIRYIKNSDKKQPRILLFDVETAPASTLVWFLGKQRISYDNVIQEWSLLSWSAKWLYDSQIISSVVTPEEAYNREDHSIIKGLWNLFNEADILIAHNAARFDIRKSNVRFIVNNLPPPTPYQVIDTLKEAKKYFAFMSYKLNDLNKLLGASQKIKTDFELWKRCIGIDNDIEDQEKALQEMVKYNRQDIKVLEDLYTFLRPWMKSHPNLGLYVDTEESICPNCGNEELDWNGHYYTTVSKFESFRCKFCGAIGRSRRNEITKDKRKNLTISIAR